MKRKTSLIVLVLLALLAVPTSAQAVTIEAHHSLGIGSTQIDGGAAYWAQTESFEYGDLQRTPKVLRRELSSGEVEVVYEVGDSERLSALNAAHGRVIVGVRNIRDDSSSVLEIVRDTAGVSTKVIASRNGRYSGLTCESRVRPVGVNAQNEILIEEINRMSRDGNCSLGLIKRLVSTISAIAPDGGTRMIIERKSGWFISESDGLLGSPRWGGGDWLALAAGSEDDAIISGGNIDLATGALIRSQFPIFDARHTEISLDGRSLTNEAGRSSTLAVNPRNPEQSQQFPARKSVRWMHFCGDKVLEVSRARGRRLKGGRGRSRGGKRWNIYIRNLDGVRERRLSQTLARGTDFDGCNGETALFHKRLRRGKARQFAVPLAPPAA